MIEKRFFLQFVFGAFFCSLLFGLRPSQAQTQESKPALQYDRITRAESIVWGFDFLNENQIIYTERRGRVHLLDLKTKVSTEIKGAPKVWARGQGGLLDIRVHPKDKSKIYMTFSEPKGEDSATTSLAVATLEKNQLTGLKILFSANATTDESIHFGSRIEFGNDGWLYISIGDRNERKRSQDMSYHNGKVIRLKEDGSSAEIFTSGHRSPQGLVKHPQTGELWLAEMGPRGGDELNLLVKGQNYGWPIVTYGREYWGPSIGVKEKPGFQAPVTYWVPSISPSAITFYTGDVFQKWKGDLFMATLSGLHLRRLKIENNKVTEQEELLKEKGFRIRNVRTGPDGKIYISTDDGQIGALSPSAPTP